MTGRRVSAIVLAGGRSSRFGRDKLAEPIAGRPLLDHAVDAVRGIAAEVLVVIAPGASVPPVPSVIVVRDPRPFEGPLAGLVAGLRVAREPIVLVVGGDMPELVVEVARLLLDAVDTTAVDAAVLEDEGRPRPLPMAVRREPASVAATRLIAAGERRLGALPDALAASVIAEPTWRALDPEARSVRDIDTPADLP